MSQGQVERILDAAYTCFARHGARRTTMDDIAREAGMSRAAVYQYVKNKDDAFRRLAQRLFDSALAEARAGAGSSTGLPDRLTAVLAAKVGLTLMVWRETPAHAEEILGDNARLSADIEVRYEHELRRLLRDVLAQERPGRQASEFVEILLAVTRGIEADPTHPGAARRRLKAAVGLLAAGWDSTPQTQE